MRSQGGRRQLNGPLIAVLAVLVVLSGTFAGRQPARAATTGVDEVMIAFQPSKVEVVAGDRVIWTNESTERHSVTFDAGPDLPQGCDPLLPVGCQAPGTTVQHTFTTPGTFRYHCKIHASQGMTGVVVVSAATTSTTASSTTTTLRASTTTRATTTSTTRALATSSTVVQSTTTTTDPSSVLLPGEAPSFTDDSSTTVTGQASQPADPPNETRRDSTTVAVIVGLLLAVSAGGGYLLWRLRPGRG
jgi:plastocyanin